MGRVYQMDNPDNYYEFDALPVDEFLPLVTFKEPSKYVVEDEELTISDEEVTLSEHLDSEKRTAKVLQLTTNKTKITLPFRIEKGSNDTWDDDGYIEPTLSIQDENFRITSDVKILKKYNTEIEVAIELQGTETTEFYLDFYANDNENDFNVGEYKNVYCGRLKIIYKVPNEWEFSQEKIEKIKQYAVANNVRYNGSGDANRYHHCTDTHKNIIYKLLDTPNDLELGKDQNHLPSANRITPNDFKKAGESTTQGIRETMIATTYAEPSKTFTVIDVTDTEVLTRSGTAGNTENALKSFKESPIAYLKSKCPENGYYVFVGAYNDDYHSFTIIVNKQEETFSFQFVDQVVGVDSYTENNFEASKLLYDVRIYKYNFPMKLELYQLRNKIK